MNKRKLELVLCAVMMLISSECSLPASASEFNCYQRSIYGVPTSFHGTRFPYPPYKSRRTKLDDLVSEGDRCYHKSNFLNASSYFGAALKLAGTRNDDSTRYWLSKQAYCLKERGQYQEAVNCYSRLPKTDVPAQYDLAFCFWKLKQPKKAKTIIAINQAKSTKDYDFTALKVQIDQRK
jgi:tetratricopeptide (TPR) repeat protein